MYGLRHEKTTSEIAKVGLEPWLGHSLMGVLVVSTLVLYGSNMVMLATVLALVDRKPLSGVWQLCYFWSLPYYLSLIHI